MIASIAKILPILAREPQMFICFQKSFTDPTIYNYNTDPKHHNFRRLYQYNMNYRIFLFSYTYMEKGKILILATMEQC